MKGASHVTAQPTTSGPSVGHRVWIDQDLCTGDGICVQEARNVFELDIDGLAYVKNADDELLTAPARLRAAGVEPRGFGQEACDEPVVLCWMPAAAVYFADPDGHSLEFLAMLPDAPRYDVATVSWSEWQGMRASGEVTV